MTETEFQEPVTDDETANEATDTQATDGDDSAEDNGDTGDN